MDLFWAVLPFLIFLLCPLMMVFCFLGMRKMGCGTSQASQPPAVAGTGAERVAALERKLAAIQAELAILHTAEAQPKPNIVPISKVASQEVKPVPEVANANQRPA